MWDLVSNLTYDYPQDGEKVAIIGEEGNGKSTLHTSFNGDKTDFTFIKGTSSVWPSITGLHSLKVTWELKMEPADDHSIIIALAEELPW